MNLHTYQIVQYSTACDSVLPAAVFGSTAAGLRRLPLCWPDYLERIDPQSCKNVPVTAGAPTFGSGEGCAGLLIRC